MRRIIRSRNYQCAKVALSVIVWLIIGLSVITVI